MKGTGEISMPCTPLTFNSGKQENQRVGHLVCFPPPTGRGRVIDAKGHSEQTEMDLFHLLLARTRVRRCCVHVVSVADFSYFRYAHDFLHFLHQSCDIISSFCAVNIVQRFSRAANPSIRPFIGCIDECRQKRRRLCETGGTKPDSNTSFTAAPLRASQIVLFTCACNNLTTCGMKFIYTW